MVQEPPFQITPAILDLVVRISRKIDSLEGAIFHERNLRLRRQNRIRSIYSSCAIEANSLSFVQVSDIVNGRRVVGQKKEIEEIKGATEAYNELSHVDPYSIDDFLKMHAVLTNGTVPESGKFRTVGEGVFAGDRLIFMAPPPEFVPEHMQNLFAWMSRNKDSVNPLILSSVFHYEMVFIHPFKDGNGRMARLWQTALLGNWNELFFWMPIETRIHKSQEDYYRTINLCNSQGDSTAFIEFMLRMILMSLEDVDFEIKETTPIINSRISRMLELMDPDRTYSSSELMRMLDLSSQPSFHRDYLRPSLDQGLLSMTEPDNPKSPNQRYRLTGRN